MATQQLLDAITRVVQDHFGDEFFGFHLSVAVPEKTFDALKKSDARYYDRSDDQIELTEGARGVTIVPHNPNETYIDEPEPEDEDDE